MKKKILVSLCVMIFFVAVGYAQNATLKGTVKEPNGDPIAFANVSLIQEGSVKNTVLTDTKGEYIMVNVSGGKYDLEVMHMGKKQNIKGFEIRNSGTTLQDIVMLKTLDVVDVIWVKPLFEGDATMVGITIDRDALIKNPARSVEGALAAGQGVAVQDGQIVSVRGNRGDGQAVYIDGVKVSGTGALPVDAVGETEMIQGGIPAEYGDATSVTNITTRGIPKRLVGSVDLRGSLEGYNNFLGSATLLGPLLKGKKDTEQPRMGFMLTAEGRFNTESSPARGGTWRASKEAIDYWANNPIHYTPQPGTLPKYTQTAEYWTFDSEIDGKKVFQKKRVRDNVSNWGYTLNGKIDFVPAASKEGALGNRLQMSIGGYFNYDKYRSWDRGNSMFNSANLPEVTSWQTRVTGRLNHIVFTDRTGEGKVKNISYNIILGYLYSTGVSQDQNHKDRYFDYGHVGYFERHKANGYSDNPEDITIDGIKYQNMTVFTGQYDSIVTFRTSDKNPLLSNYMLSAMNAFSVEDFHDIGVTSVGFGAYQALGALINGESPNGVYSLYGAPGAVVAGYKKSSTSSIQAKASLSLVLQKHDIKLGFQLEKETSRAFSIAPIGLWTLMRSLANSHTQDLDIENPYFVGSDTVMYNQRIALDAQSTFDRNLRIALGKDPNGNDWLDVDNLDPKTFNLGMFSSTELLTGNGSPMISYYGYDYTGAKKITKKTSIADFFKKDNNNPIGAYEPVYMAMYIQDKFSINNLIFNVGVRIDRFDANQSVLKDPYLFREVYTVGDLKSRNMPMEGMLSTASDNWVVYVTQKDQSLDASDFNSKNILAYRDGNVWYDASGQQIADPETKLGANGGPILKNEIDRSQSTKVEAGAFQDYKPQWSVMPRVSFSFPVDVDNSLFFANYSIITTRPTQLQINPIEYYFVEKYFQQQTSINNPNLKPQRSIDYEIGFKQRIGKNSALNISAFYSEKKDMIQSYRYSGAYPSTYYSYENIDFGTVQGISVGYLLQQMKGIRLNVGYSIQFAKGTGSDAGTQKGIIASGQPNLRTLTNLSFDQRHSLSATFSYEFGSGSDYTGPTARKEKKSINGEPPVVKETRWLENVGIYLILAARSGLPYSRSSIPNSSYVAGTSSQLTGSINGSYKPWQFQCDLHIEKAFTLNFENKKNPEKNAGKKIKKGSLTVYLDITNLLNLKNIVSVYSYTGNPDDDGYLSAEQYRNSIQGQVYPDSFIDYYTMRMKDPYNYSRPCRVNLGIQFGF